ncbi:MAG: DUF3561 family protein [Symbiopectobacterium sp.]
MQNVTQLSVSKRPMGREDERTYPFGAIAGFSFYWLAFVVPICVYGSNTTLFLCSTYYIWPFFSADNSLRADRRVFQYDFQR